MFIEFYVSFFFNPLVNYPMKANDKDLLGIHMSEVSYEIKMTKERG